jgi:hypothetical protein
VTEEAEEAVEEAVATVEVVAAAMAVVAVAVEAVAVAEVAEEAAVIVEAEEVMVVAIVEAVAVMRAAARLRQLRLPREPSSPTPLRSRSMLNSLGIALDSTSRVTQVAAFASNFLRLPGLSWPKLTPICCSMEPTSTL